MICAKVNECKTILHNGQVKFQIELCDSKGKKVHLLLDDSDVTTLIVYGIEHLNENMAPGAVRLKECLVDMAMEVYGKDKDKS